MSQRIITLSNVRKMLAASGHYVDKRVMDTRAHRGLIPGVFKVGDPSDKQAPLVMYYDDAIAYVKGYNPRKRGGRGKDRYARKHRDYAAEKLLRDARKRSPYSSNSTSS